MSQKGRDALKPCPFCGGALKWDERGFWAVYHTDDCFLERILQGTAIRPERVEAWNRRHPDALQSEAAPTHHPDCASLHGFAFCNCVAKDFAHKAAPVAKTRRWRCKCGKILSMKNVALKPGGTPWHYTAKLTWCARGPVEEVSEGGTT